MRCLCGHRADNHVKVGGDIGLCMYCGCTCEKFHAKAYEMSKS